MTQSLNQRFSYSNPPHFTYPSVTDWHVFDDGERISISELVEMANQQEAHIATLLSEIQRLNQLEMVQVPAAIRPSSTQLSLSSN